MIIGWFDFVEVVLVIWVGVLWVVVNVDFILFIEWGLLFGNGFMVVVLCMVIGMDF